MSLSGDRLAHAEARADKARAQFRATATRLHQRLMPRRLLEDALIEARGIGETGAERAKRHPLLVAGLTALLAGLTLWRRRRRDREATDAASESLPAKAKNRRSRRSR